MLRAGQLVRPCSGCRPHHFNFTDGMYAVNEHFQRVDGPTYGPATVDKIALHHYVLKSEQVRSCRVPGVSMPMAKQSASAAENIAQVLFSRPCASVTNAGVQGKDASRQVCHWRLLFC